MRSPGMKRSSGVKRCAPTKFRVDEPNGNIYANLRYLVRLQDWKLLNLLNLKG